MLGGYRLRHDVMTKEEFLKVVKFTEDYNANTGIVTVRSGIVFNAKIRYSKLEESRYGDIKETVRDKVTQNLWSQIDGGKEDSIAAALARIHWMKEFFAPQNPDWNSIDMLEQVLKKAKI
jgi:hypothetical protein